MGCPACGHRRAVPPTAVAWGPPLLPQAARRPGDQLSAGGGDYQAASTCCSLPLARPNGGVPGAAWTSPPDSSHSQVSRTELPKGRGGSPAAFVEVPDTAQKPAVSGTSGIHSGSSPHGWTPWESRKLSSTQTGVASEPAP